jgi:cell wall-associated NlpC family hydrolase
MRFVLLRICTLLLGGLWLVGCASTGAVPSPFPIPGGGHSPEPVPEASSAAPFDGYSIAGTALGLRGVPYRSGGSDPSGFDCSGFVWYVFAQHRLALPRTVEDQYRIGEKVDSDSLEPGDLVFFRTEGRSVSHVGMSIGGDQFVHAPSARGEVRVERLGTNYWWPRFAGARRVR